MNTLKEQRIKTLERDINKLFNKLIKERISQEDSAKYGNSNVTSKSNYREYFDSSNILIERYMTYKFYFLNAGHSKEEFYNNACTTGFTIWINKEIDAIHKLIEKCQENNLAPQYKTLNKIYDKFITITTNLPELSEKNEHTKINELYDVAEDYANRVVKQEKNQNVLDKLNKEIDGIYIIRENENIMDNIKCLLLKYFNDLECKFPIDYHQDININGEDLNTVNFELRIGNAGWGYIALKDILIRTLPYTNGYIAIVRDGKLIIEKKSIIIED